MGWLLNFPWQFGCRFRLVQRLGEQVEATNFKGERDANVPISLCVPYDVLIDLPNFFTAKVFPSNIGGQQEKTAWIAKRKPAPKHCSGRQVLSTPSWLKKQSAQGPLSPNFIKPLGEFRHEPSTDKNFYPNYDDYLRRSIHCRNCH